MLLARSKSTRNPPVLSASQLQIAGTAVAVATKRKLPADASVDIIAAGMQSPVWPPLADIGFVRAAGLIGDPGVPVAGSVSDTRGS